MPKYLIPTKVVITDELPKNHMGKVNKKELLKTFFNQWSWCSSIKTSTTSTFILSFFDIIQGTMASLLYHTLQKRKPLKNKNRY